MPGHRRRESQVTLSSLPQKNAGPVVELHNLPFLGGSRNYRIDSSGGFSWEVMRWDTVVTVAQDTDLASRGNEHQRADVPGWLFKYPSIEISKKANGPRRRPGLCFASGVKL